VIKRSINPPPEHLYPPDEWRVIEARLDLDYARRAETVFALSNGYIGVRGTFDEGRPAHSAGTFINGFYESWPIRHPEEAFGLAATGQTLVAVPDATITQLYVDDEPLFLPVANCRAYRRVLDMLDGTLVRELVWSTPSGKHVLVKSSRFVSLEQRHLLVIRYEVTVLDHAAPIAIRSRLVNTQDEHVGDGASLRDLPGDPRLARAFDHRVLCERYRSESGGRVLLGYETANSRMTLGLAAGHLIEGHEHHAQFEHETEGSSLLITASGTPGHTLRITKYVAYHTSRTAPVAEVVARACQTLDRVTAQPFDTLATAQRHQLRRFWDRADVVVRRADAAAIRLQQAIRWNLFQLIQASARAEGAGIPAKGLTSQGYEGHYFWDTEIYVLPFLTYTQPRIARNLLRFRHSMLTKARARAASLNQRGALFPWRTINGEEASANFQSGTAQYHINADIAHAIRRYVDVRDDIGFLAEAGAEMLVESARMWEDLGFYDQCGSFHIHGVTGPDEYTTVVNDNTYTNLMARLNLNQAASAVRRLESEDFDSYVALCHRCHLTSDEAEAWERAAAAMHVPYDEARGIHPQDGAFLDREVWDLNATPADKFPLLLHYHPLVIYRYQVLKQADIVLAMFLLGNEFTPEQKLRNFTYYDPLTTGDSSLSAGIESIIAAEVGRADEAMTYFTYALLIDLGDISQTAPDGVHIASAAATWMALVFGFGGVRDYDGHLTFDPRLPCSWESLEFHLRFRDRQLRIQLTHHQERYLLEQGEPLHITVRGEPVLLRPDAPAVISLQGEDAQGPGKAVARSPQT
jgi:alpha,alpha-trehalose phosphorylase